MRNSRQLVISQVSKCRGKILITQDMRGPEGIRSFKVNSNIQTVQETSGVNIPAQILKIVHFNFKNFLVFLLDLLLTKAEFTKKIEVELIVENIENL